MTPYTLSTPEGRAEVRRLSLAFLLVLASVFLVMWDNARRRPLTAKPYTVQLPPVEASGALRFSSSNYEDQVVIYTDDQRLVVSDGVPGDLRVCFGESCMTADQLRVIVKKKSR